MSTSYVANTVVGVISFSTRRSPVEHSSWLPFPMAFEPPSLASQEPLAAVPAHCSALLWPHAPPARSLHPPFTSSKAPCPLPSALSTPTPLACLPHLHGPQVKSCVVKAPAAQTCWFPVTVIAAQSFISPSRKEGCAGERTGPMEGRQCHLREPKARAGAG